MKIMLSLRKWFYKPKRDDKSLLAQFFYADEALNLITTELDSFNGRKDPERCTTLVNMLRQSQDRVLTIINNIMDELIPNERANRDFRVKFPEDVLQENLPGQLWFGAECLAAGSSIMNREAESTQMRPLAKAVTKSLDNVRHLLREACLKNHSPNGSLALPNDEYVCESLKIFDRLFSEFELNYVSAMVPVKTTQEYELQEFIGVLFSETLQRALKMKLLTQEQVDDYDPALMFTIPRLAIVTGLLIYPNGPLCIDKPPEQMSDMFRPFQNLLHKIRELLWTLNKCELYKLEKLLCDNEQINGPIKDAKTTTELDDEKSTELDDYISRFYNDYPICKDYITNYKVTTNEIQQVECKVVAQTYTDCSSFPDYEIISDSSLDNYYTLNNSLVNISINENGETTVKNDDERLNDETKFLNGALNLVNDSLLDKNQHRHLSSTIDIPSTSSREGEFNEFFSNTQVNDNLQTANNLAQSSKENSLPDRDSYETISVATATLTTLINGACNKTENGKCQANIENNLESPLDSGISTENTSLDRSPSLDLINNDKLNTQSVNDNSQTAKNIPTVTLTTIPCQCNLVDDYTLSNCDKASTSDSKSPQKSPSSRRNMTLKRLKKREKKLSSIESKAAKNQHESSPSRLSVGGSSSDETSSFNSECADDEEIALALQAAEIANRNEIRAKYRSSDDLVHRLFVCIAGVADQLQTNFASDLRNILKSVFLMNAAQPEQNDNSELTNRKQEEEQSVETNNYNSNIILNDYHDNSINEYRNNSNSINEYRALESDVILRDDSIYSIDATNILAEEALFDPNIYCHFEQAFSDNENIDDENNRQKDLETNQILYSDELIGETSHHHHQSNDLHVYNELSNQNDLVVSQQFINSVNNDVNYSIESNHNYYYTPNQQEPENDNTSLDQQSPRIVNMIDDHSSRLENMINERPPIWIPDIEAPKCMSCEANFTVVKRRHHCRNCGKVFCARCSSNSVPLPKFGHTKPVRVCNKCFMYQITPFTI